MCTRVCICVWCESVRIHIREMTDSHIAYVEMWAPDAGEHHCYWKTQQL